MPVFYKDYKYFQVDSSIKLEEVHSQWKELNKKYHPDINKSDDANEITKEINAEYQEILQHYEPFKNQSQLDIYRFVKTSMVSVVQEFITPEQEDKIKDKIKNTTNETIDKYTPQWAKVFGVNYKLKKDTSKIIDSLSAERLTEKAFDAAPQYAHFAVNAAKDFLKRAKEFVNGYKSKNINNPYHE